MSENKKRPEPMPLDDKSVLFVFKRDPSERTTDWEFVKFPSYEEAMTWAKTIKLVDSYCITGTNLNIITEDK